MNKEEQYWRLSLIAILLITGYILGKQALPFLNGILGAVTLYILLRNPMRKLAKHTGQKTAVWLVTIGVSLLILLPLSLTVWALIDKLLSSNLHPHALITGIEQGTAWIKDKTGFDLLSENRISLFFSKASSVGQSLIQGVSDAAVNLFTAVFLLFFMLSSDEEMEKWIKNFLPFKDQNKKDVIDKIRQMVRSNAIGIPLLACIQGIIAFIGYLIFGVSDPGFYAILTGLASIIPFIGTALIWLPLSIYAALTSQWFTCIGLLAYGSIIVSQCDNFIRFILQKKMANTHPLITIFGVIAGLPIFGFMGLIFGPLLVSLFMLFMDMFRQEYLTDD